MNKSSTGEESNPEKHFTCKNTYGYYNDDDDEEYVPPKRHKAEPLKPIQDNIENDRMNVSEISKTPKHGRVLGFDETMHDAANFIDPKSLFVCMF